MISTQSTQHSALPGQKTTSNSDIKIETPLAPARPKQGQVYSSASVGSGSGSGSYNPTRSFTQDTEVVRQMRLQQLEKDYQTQKKYSSIDSLDRHQKQEALAKKNVNPFLLKDPYDGYAVALNRWKNVANDAVLSHFSEADKERVAGKYYDAMIGPQLARMGKPGLNRDLWVKQAFREGVEYKLENAYDSNVLHDLKHGWNEGVPALARMGETVYNVLDNFFSKPKEHTDEEYSPWFKSATEAESAPKAFTDARHPDSMVNRGSRIQQENHKFWADTLPEKGGWGAKSTSFIAEQAAQLPAYAAVAAIPAVGAETLTARLGMTGVGKLALKYLMTGAEGTAFGTLTRPKEDKQNAWQDGLSWSIFHMGLDITGATGSKILSALGGKGKATLAEAVESAGNLSKFAELKKRQDVIDLAYEGKRQANEQEIYEQFKKEHASNISVVGLSGQRAIYADALRHIENMETVEGGNWSRSQVKDYEKTLLDPKSGDPARWSPVLSAANYVRSLLGEKKLRSIEGDQETMKFLTSRISKLIVDSASSVHQAVPEMAEGNAKQEVKQLASGSGKRTLEYYKAQVQSEASKNGAAGLLKPEQLDAMAQDRWVKDIAKTRALAEVKLSKTPNKDIRRAIKKFPAFETRSERVEVSPKDISVRYSLNPTYKVFLKNLSKGVNISMNSREFSDYLAKFYDGMEDRDFAHDLLQHFYPQELKDAGVFFENQGALAGPEYPNFLAFMHNYKDQMPLEMAKELEDRLIGTGKFQEAFKAGGQTQSLLDYYSQAMYNHVDDFLGSGHWPKESNLFRSSSFNVRNTTKWQKQLLLEKMQVEEKQFRDVFSKHSEALKVGLKHLKALQVARMKSFLQSYDENPNSRKAVAELNALVAGEITKTGKYEKWSF